MFRSYTFCSENKENKDNVILFKWKSDGKKKNLNKLASDLISRRRTEWILIFPTLDFCRCWTTELKTEHMLVNSSFITVRGCDISLSATCHYLCLLLLSPADRENLSGLHLLQFLFTFVKRKKRKKKGWGAWFAKQCKNYATIRFFCLFSIISFTVFHLWSSLLLPCSWCMLLWHEGPEWPCSVDVSDHSSFSGHCAKQKPPLLFCLWQHASEIYRVVSLCSYPALSHVWSTLAPLVTETIPRHLFHSPLSLFFF